MEWTIIDKKTTIYPKKVSQYGDYKPYLRTEASEKCVYCAIHENPIGGSDSFHVEHYKPKSLPKFKALIKDYYNLFYSCAVCNRFKSNDWPNDPVKDHSIVAYPDPNVVDYNSIFEISENGIIKGKYVASKYMVEKIFLNRPQLINERREYFIKEKLINIIEDLKKLKELLKTKKGNPKTLDFFIKMDEIKDDILLLHNKEKTISRYQPEEIKKPKTGK